jgi:hypothetical protein
MVYAFGGINTACKSLYFSKDAPIIANSCENFTSAFSANPMGVGVNGSLVLESASGQNFTKIFFRSNLSYIEINMRNATTINGAFAESYSLVTLVIEFGENIVDTSSAFNGANSLRNLIASGIIATTISFASSAKLTAESAISVINCLKDFSGTENELVHTITFHANTKTALDALGAVAPNGLTWLEYALSKGWNA